MNLTLTDFMASHQLHLHRLSQLEKGNSLHNLKILSAMQQSQKVTEHDKIK